MSELPDELLGIIGAARSGELSEDHVTDLWGTTLVFDRRADGSLTVAEWYPTADEGHRRAFTTTLSLEDHSDEEVARMVRSEFAWQE